MRPRQDEQVRSGRAFRGGNSTRGCGRVTVSCTGPRRSEGRAGEEKGRGAELAVTLHARQKDAILYCRAHLRGEGHLQKQVQVAALGLGTQTGCGQFQAYPLSLLGMVLSCLLLCFLCD